MNYIVKRVIIDISLAVLFGLAILLTAHVTEAAEPVKRATIPPAQAVASWNKLNDQCVGSASANPPECAQRDRLGKRMASAGMIRTRFDVWVTAAQADAMAAALDAATQRAMDTGRPVAGELAMRQSLDDLRIPDDVVVGWWLSMHSIVQQANPLAWAIMSDVVNAVCVAHHGQQPYSMDF